MRLNSIGIVGYGNFGTFVHVLLSRFLPEIQVKVFTPEHEADGTLFFSRDDVAQCDAVVFAVPISAYEDALKNTVPLMNKEGIIVDVATVKMYTVDLLKKFSAGRPYIATHPMFGPESYAKRKKDVSGFRVVITEHALASDTYAACIAFLRGLKFNVIEMSADEHDTQLAETLFLTHFVGQIVTRAGFVRTDIDTVSFGFLMDAVESVKNDMQLFRDVYTYNPHCAAVMQRFGIAESAIQKSLEVS